MNQTTPIRNRAAEQPLSPWQLFWRRLKQRRIAMAGGVILIVLYLVAIFAGFVAPYSYDRQDRDRFFHPPTSPRLSGFRLVVPRYEQLPGAFVYRAVADDTKPIHFFVHGGEYKLFGLIPATVHLFGTGDKNYPVICLARTSSGVTFCRDCSTARKFRSPSASSAFCCHSRSA